MNPNSRIAPVACSAQGATGNAGTQRKNGANTALSCTATGATSCQNTSSTVTVAAGDTITVFVSDSLGGASPVRMTWSAQVGP